MTVAGVSPTIRQRDLAPRLRNLRIERNMTVEQVEKDLMCSPAKVSRLETARRLVPRDVRDLCDIYKVGAPEAATPYGALNLLRSLGLEQEASSIYAISDIAFTLLEFSEPMLSPCVFVVSLLVGQLCDWTCLVDGSYGSLNSRVLLLSALAIR